MLENLNQTMEATYIQQDLEMAKVSSIQKNI